MSVAESPLVKTAIYGEDPNWGRLIMAIGKSPTATMNPNTVSIKIQGIELYKKGEPTNFNDKEVKKRLEKEDVTIKINLNCGKSQAQVWGCDLTHGYIDINVDYN